MSERFEMGFFGRLVWLVAGTGGLLTVWFGSNGPTRDFGAMFVQLASLLPFYLRRFVEGPRATPVSWRREVIGLILVLIVIVPLGIHVYLLSEQKRHLLVCLVLSGLWVGVLISEGFRWWRGRAHRVVAGMDTPDGTDPG